MFMTYQPKKRQRKKNMVLEKEWALNQEETFLRAEDKKEEKN